MLGYQNIFLCPKCEKVILEEKEISNPSKENSICCDSCNTWWHLPCAALTEHCVESLDSWICCSCLVDNADLPGCDLSSSDNESTVSDLGGASTSDGRPNSVCGVCCKMEIPVGREHICSICKSAVHAWCSNHDDITNSSELVCKRCTL